MKLTLILSKKINPVISVTSVTKKLLSIQPVPSKMVFSYQSSAVRPQDFGLIIEKICEICGQKLRLKRNRMKNLELSIKNSTLIIIIVLCLVFSGCQPSSTRSNQTIDYSPIAGTWKAENSPWQVTISDEGKVISAIHPLGEVVVKPNETTTIEMKDGSKSTYTGGDFTLIYEPEKKEMEVTLKVEKIHIRFLDNEIKGNSETTIVGFISGDFKRWNTDVIEKNDYGTQFPQSEIPNPIPTTFLKIQ